MLEKEKTDKIYIYGKHSIEEALLNMRDIVEEIFFINRDDRIYDIAKKYKIKITHLDKNSIPRWVDKDSVHQGVIALVSEKKLLKNYKEFISSLNNIDNKTAIVILGELQDPQNVGAIIRSARAFGMSAVFIPEHNQAQITSSVVKVSAGMAFKIPLVRIGNVNHTVRDLKDRGFWIYGLDMNTKNSITKEKFDSPSVFIMGNEGKGIREKTTEICDIMLSIPIDKKCESLNVASSASVVMYEWYKQTLE